MMHLRTITSIVVILVIHVFLVAHATWVLSPTYGEVPALTSGVLHWHSGKFDVFRVNPPLVRLVASFPVVLASPEVDWSKVDDLYCYRCEFEVGSDFIHANGERSRILYALGRMACIPFTILGALVCYIWARQLYGGVAGIVALLLWCFSPNILGYAPLISGDVQSSAMGVLACYCFWKWLRNPSLCWTCIAGMALGGALTTKTTFLILIPIWMLLWIVKSEVINKNPLSFVVWREFVKLLGIWFLAVCCINSIYGMTGSFEQLGNYRFISRAFGGDVPASVRCAEGANRFEGTWLGEIPIPLPRDYVLGIDIQKRDFECISPAYMRGVWNERGFWYYYLYGLLIKTPVSTLILFAVSIALNYFTKQPFDLLTLLMAPVGILILASSQTGLNDHFRYVLPVLPFLFIFISRIGQAITFSRPFVSGAIITLICGSVLSSLFVYPNTLSYFNLAVGGPSNGYKHLLGSSTDWGQDVYLLKEYYESHLSPAPLSYAHVGGFDPTDIGLPLLDLHFSSNKGGTPQIGWFAISVNRLYDRSNEFACLRNVLPSHRIGYSTLIFRIDQELVHTLLESSCSCESANPKKKR